jgi:hypothetical protein
MAIVLAREMPVVGASTGERMRKGMSLASMADVAQREPLLAQTEMTQPELLLAQTETAQPKPSSAQAVVLAAR